MWTRFARWAVLKLPKTLVFNPFEVFLSLLCVLSGTPFLLGLAPEPGSIEALLPGWLSIIWGANLVVGGLATAIGVLSDRPVIERVGMNLLAPVALIYGAAIFLLQGPPGLVASGIVLAFGIACFFRLLVLTSSRSFIRERAKGNVDSRS